MYPFVIVKLGEIVFDLKKFFEKLTNNLNLGDLVEEPSRVSGGLTHKMYKVFTIIRDKRSKRNNRAYCLL